MVCGVIRVMHRTREVEADKEESDNLGQLDQIPRASSTLGEPFSSFITPGPAATLGKSLASLSLPQSLASSVSTLRLHHLTYQVPWCLLVALKALPGPTILNGETDPQSFSPSSSPGKQPKAGREL